MLNNALLLMSTNTSVTGCNIRSLAYTYTVYISDESTGKEIASMTISPELPKPMPPLTVNKEYRISASYEWYVSASFSPSSAAHITRVNQGGDYPKSGYVCFIPTSANLELIEVNFNTSA